MLQNIFKSFQWNAYFNDKNQIEKPNFNVQKLSGQCGSLMCCLGYENDYYKEFRPLYPNSGDTAELKMLHGL